MCDTNWTQLLKEYEKDFGKWFLDTDTGKKLYFLGLLHSGDDYYFAMSEPDGHVILYSCVASMAKKRSGDKGGSIMKGKGIQVTNKAYREGYERTFKRPTLLEKRRAVADELERNIESLSSLDSPFETGYFISSRAFNSDSHNLEDLKANFIERTEICVEDINAKPLMESSVLDINHFEGLD